MKKPAQFAIGFSLLSATTSFGAKQSTPYNILCITCEDIGQYIGCFGDMVAKTPNLDEFAKESIRYSRMYTTIGVSAPSRAALITGMYPSSIGANNMRNYMPASEGKGKTTPVYDVVLPDGVKCYTEYMRAKGFYCTNSQKNDYQFAPPLTAWDENGTKAHWKNRPEGQPFFSIFNLDVTHESQIWKRANEPLVVDPNKLVVPPYYPNDPIIRRDMAIMYSNIAEMDRQFGQKIKELKEAGLYDNTIIIWYSDNGGPIANQKRSIYERGTLVPFMIRFPDHYRAGEIDDRLCMFPDIPATILSIAGIKTPSTMQGQPFLGKFATAKRQYIYGARDRMDEQVDKQGAIRDKQFRYVVNYNAEKPGYMPIAYRLQMPMMRRMIELYQKDSLNEVQKRWFTAPRAKEELFDVANDPHELNNLIDNPLYTKDLQRLKKEYNHWLTNYNKNWFRTEDDNIKQFKPNGVQPTVAKPTIQLSNNKIRLKTATKGASLAYQIDGKAYNRSENWYLYSQPFTVLKGSTIKVKAVRTGYIDSETTEKIL